MIMNRRTFIGGAAVGAFAVFQSAPVLAASPRVVVVGGGMAGATLAKYLRLWSKNAIDVTLVDPKSTYVSNIMSNLVITGDVPRSALNFKYDKLVKKYGINVVKGTVTDVSDPVEGVRKVTVVSGGETRMLRADKVVVAPGIQFAPIERVGSGPLVPLVHAWVAGPQTELLKQQLADMPAGGRFVLTIPKAPYRCPPGPYERACLVADYVRRNKPGSSVVVLDENPGIIAEKETFERAFNVTYGGIIDYRPGMKVVSVSRDNKTVNFKSVSASEDDPYTPLNAAVLNVIPPNRANEIARRCGLVDSSGFAPVDVRSFESTLTGKAGIHVIGDSATNTGLPMAGHVGNQGAKICAAAIVNLFANAPVEPSPTANSACFSPISNAKASWLTAVYHYEPTQKKMVIKSMLDGRLVPSAPVEAAAPTVANFSSMSKWFSVLMKDSFA